MTYRENHNKYKESGISIYKALIAEEVDCQLSEFNKTEEDFENICSFIYDWIMDSSETVDNLCQTICWALKDKDITIEDFIDNWGKITEEINSRI